MAAATTASPIEQSRPAFALSGKAKEAIKVGLAIVVTYWLALKFSWMSPTWAAVAVAVISQPGEGQSLYKGLLRAIGTLLAFFSSLVLLALFPQDRWMLFVGVSPVLGYFAYKMKGENDYLWYVAGFVTVMIITAGPQQPGHAFEFAAYRTMETLIGIGVWAVISSLLWPVTNLGVLKSATDALLDAQRQVAQHGFELLSHRDGAGSPPALLAQEAQLVAKVGSLINVASSETYEVRVVRRSWLALQQASLKFMHTANRLRLGAEDLEQIDMDAALPALPDLSAELGARFAEARSLLAGKPSARPCREVSLEIDRQAIGRLDHFQRAAVEVARTELEQLDAQTRTMVDCALGNRGRARGRRGGGASIAKPLRGPAGSAADRPRPIDRCGLRRRFRVGVGVDLDLHQPAWSRRLGSVRPDPRACGHADAACEVLSSASDGIRVPRRHGGLRVHHAAPVRVRAARRRLLFAFTLHHRRTSSRQAGCLLAAGDAHHVRDRERADLRLREHGEQLTCTR